MKTHLRFNGPVRTCLGACLSVLVAGCAALPELAWNQADDVILGRVNDWLELEPRQQARLQERLQPWLRKIRRDRLPEVAAAVEGFAARIEPGMDLQDAHWVEGRFRELYDDTMRSFLPVITPTLAGLHASQLRHLEQRIAEENREDRERFTEGRDDGRYALGARIIEQIERWTGPLDVGQRQLIHDRTRAFPDTSGSWLDYRERMQRRLLDRLEADASAAELEQLLVEWWIDRSGRSPGEARDAAAFRQAMRETLIAVARTLTPAQRAEARRRLRDRAALLRQLAESAD